MPAVTDDRNPIEQAVEQALDAFVYAPIGLVFDGPSLFPTLVEKGRNQVQVARMMGKMAVQMGQSEAEKRMAAAEGPLREVLVAAGLAPPVPPPAAQPEPTVTSSRPTKASAVRAEPAATQAATEPAVKKPAAKKRAAKKPAVKKPAAKKPAAKKTTTRKTSTKKTTVETSAAPAKKAAAPAVSSLSIPDYDSLSASQVVKRLRGMPGAELDAIRDYEAATRARKTILNRITQIRKG